MLPESTLKLVEEVGDQLGPVVEHNATMAKKYTKTFDCESKTYKNTIRLRYHYVDDQNISHHLFTYAVRNRMVTRREAGHIPEYYQDIMEELERTFPYPKKC